MKKLLLIFLIPIFSFTQNGDTNGDGFTNLEDLFNVLENWLQNVNDNDPEAISNLDEMTNLVDSLITLNQNINYGMSIDGWVEHDFQITQDLENPFVNEASSSGILQIRMGAGYDDDFQPDYPGTDCLSLEVFINDNFTYHYIYEAFAGGVVATIPLKIGDQIILFSEECEETEIYFFSFGDSNVPNNNQSNSNNQNNSVPFSNMQDNITNGELWTWTPSLPEYPCSECPTWDWGSIPDDIVFDQLDSDLYVVPEGKILKITSTNFENVNATVFRDGEEFSLNYAECVQTLTCTSPCASWSPTLNDLSHMTLMEGDTLLLSPIVYASSINVYGDYGLLEGIQPVNAQTLFGYIEDMGTNTPIYKRIVPSSPTYTVPDGKRLVIQYFYAYGTEGATLNIEAEDFNGEYSYSILNEIPLLSNTTITINFSTSENFCQNHFLLSGYLVNDE